MSMKIQRIEIFDIHLLTFYSQSLILMVILVKICDVFLFRTVDIDFQLSSLFP